MACINYNKLWRSDFFNNVSAKDKKQDTNFNQIKLKVNDTYRKNEKIATKFEALNDEDNKNKAYKQKIEGRSSLLEKHYIDFQLRKDKHL